MARATTRKPAAKIEREIDREVEHERPALVRLGVGTGLFLLGATVAAVALLAIREPDAPKEMIAGGGNGGGSGAAASDGEFTPPTLANLPKGPEGEAIRNGMAIFNMTYAAPDAMKHVGNGLACTNCHIDTGRRANSAPMWAAWVKFPEFYARNGSITTMTDRIKGCFTNSMNAQDSPAGGPPPDGSSIYSDLQMYFAWLATGAPVGARLSGGGFVDLAQPPAGFDPKRGATVYAKVCAACHGPNGAGASQPDGTVVYPALWGPRSYNWGAGMAVINLAAAFIKANMPFDKPGTLSDQDSWDVAAYINSQERPRDPRQAGSVAATAKAQYQGFPTYYGKEVDGRLLGSGVAGGPMPNVPVLKKGDGIADPAVAAMAQASQGS